VTKVYNQRFQMQNFPREIQAFAKLMGVSIEMHYRMPRRKDNTERHQEWAERGNIEGEWVFYIRKPGVAPMTVPIKKGRDMYTTREVAKFREALETYVRTHM
jgi:hypothetical protein